MDTYEKILVVFLASALAILLTLTIIVLIKIIKIINRVNRISEKAELAIGKFSDLSAVMQRFVTPMMLGKFIARFFKYKKNTKRGKDA